MLRLIHVLVSIEVGITSPRFFQTILMEWLIECKITTTTFRDLEIIYARQYRSCVCMQQVRVATLVDICLLYTSDAADE